jgi:uncharacterized protein YneF (UPF0154 family)
MLRLSYRGKSRQKTMTMPNWAFGLMAAGSAALGIALFLVVSTLAVLLLPIVLIVGGVTAFIMRKRIEKLLRQGGFPVGEEQMRRAQRKPRAPKADIEDADYRVVDEPPRKTS